MTSTIYSGLVAKVLGYGDIRKSPFQFHEYYNYLADGFDRSHVPDLIRILNDDDDELADADADSSEVWAQSHAWRILRQLRATEAIVPLLHLLRYIDERDDDWVQEEVPGVLAQIGPAVLGPAADFLADPENGVWACVGALTAIEAIGKEYPESRARCVQIVSQQLEQFAVQDGILNAALIDCLTEFKAVETAPLIKQAFASGNVDMTLHGDWEDVQIELGLLAERTTAEQNLIWENPFDLFDSDELSDDWDDWDEEDDEEDDEDDEEEDDEEYQADAKEPRIIQRADIDPVKKKRKRKEAEKQRRIQRKRKKK